VEPIKALLLQGVAPRPLAWGLAIGTAIGILPLLGITSIVGVAVATVFRLNQVAVQIAGWLAYPLQLALIIPFLGLGERLFAARPVPLVLSEMLAFFERDPGGFFAAYGLTAWHGFLAWAIVVPLPTVLLQFVLQKLLERSARRLRERSHAAASASVVPK